MNIPLFYTENSHRSTIVRMVIDICKKDECVRYKKEGPHEEIPPCGVIGVVRLVPLEHYLATLARLHHVEALLELGNGEVVGDYG